MVLPKLLAKRQFTAMNNFIAQPQGETPHPLPKVPKVPKTLKTKQKQKTTLTIPNKKSFKSLFLSNL